MGFNSAAPGRGPGRLGATYNVELVDGSIFVGRFVGVVLGATKPADTLHWMVDGERRATRYETIAATHRLAVCPACGKRTLTRQDERDWHCVLCGHETERPHRHEGRPSYAAVPPEGGTTTQEES